MLTFPVVFLLDICLDCLKKNRPDMFLSDCKHSLNAPVTE